MGSQEFERGYERLQSLIQSHPEESLNEATTRFALIDPLLTDVLAWPSNTITCEQHHDGDFFDYTLGTLRKLAVLEAKRTARVFTLPAGITAGKVKLSTIRDHSKQNRDAIDQVLGYCQKSGIPIAILCNGNQLIAFMGSRSDGISPRDGTALLYCSLNDMLNDFNTFWDYLSISGLGARNLERYLSSNRPSTLPPKPLSDSINNYPGTRLGTEMETDLRILGDLFIQDIAENETVTDEFLRECYCNSGALSQYASVSKEILRTRYLSLEENVRSVVSVRNKRGLEPSLSEDLIKGAITRRPIILLGDVGVGKTMFLKHLLRIEARDVLKGAIVFYIDFLKYSGLTEDIVEQLYRDIKIDLSIKKNISIEEDSFIRDVYCDELQEFQNGIYGPLQNLDPQAYIKHEIEMLAKLTSNKEEHLKRSFEYLSKKRHWNFVIALDNVDQHTSEYQERIFMTGQAMAEKWPVTIFMSLRPDTFHQSRGNGAIAAYQPKVFTVSPPRSDEVILKRLRFALSQLKQHGRLPSFPSGFTLDSVHLKAYIEVLIQAFDENSELVELIDNLSGGNTRRALDFISTFVGSGYVQTARILSEHMQGRTYIVPLHEFLRAILYRDGHYYAPDVSKIANLFDISSSDRKEHFLLPLLLSFCQTQGLENGGFLSLPSLFQALESHGFSAEQIQFHLDSAQKYSLIEIKISKDDVKSVRVTTTGAYMHSKLVSFFSYLDAIVVTTPIIDPSYRAKIKVVNDIEDRIDRAELFVEYLIDAWCFGDESCGFSVAKFKADCEDEFTRVRRGAQRAAERRK